MNVVGEPSPGSPLIPDILYSFFQMEFGCVTAGILMGGIAERGRLLPAMVFIFIWMTLVYCPLAYWPWGKNGWASKWGVLDFAGTVMICRASYVPDALFAGGGPVEIGSGVGGLAYAWVLGRRRETELLNFRPHNVSFVGLGSMSSVEASYYAAVSEYLCSVHIVVWLARIQWWQRIRRKSPSNLCHMEYNDRRCFWRYRLVFDRLPI